MRKFIELTVLLAIGIIASCSGIRVSQDYDISTNFFNYNTFALSPEPPRSSGNYLMDSPLIDQRIRQAIENTLVSKGYRKVADTGPDFKISYQMIVSTRIETDVVPGYMWGGYPYRYRRYYYPYWDGFAYETYVTQYDEGTLVIDFIDSQTQKLFWRGVGSRRILQQSTPERVSEWINQIVMEVLAQYPPLPTGR